MARNHTDHEELTSDTTLKARGHRHSGRSTTEKVCRSNRKEVALDWTKKTQLFPSEEEETAQMEAGSGRQKVRAQEVQNALSSTMTRKDEKAKGDERPANT